MNSYSHKGFLKIGMFFLLRGFEIGKDFQLDQ
jgi:hypothetical protein